MKKFLVGAVSLSLLAAATISSASSTNTHARWCGWHDYFHLSSDAPAGITVISAMSNDLKITPMTNAFDLSDRGDCLPSGSAIVTMGTDENNQCILAISDGSYVNTPSIAPQCKGNLHFVTMTYDGFLTYQYTLHFSKS